GSTEAMGSNPRGPTLFPLLSCASSSSSSSLYAVGCVAVGHVPAGVTFSWTDATNQSMAAAVVAFPEARGAGGNMAASRLELPLQEGKGQRSNLNPSPSPFLAERDAKPPTLYVFPPPPEQLSLLCVITGFSPPPVEVEWLVDGVPDQLVVTTTPPRREAGSNTYVATSQTNVSREDWKAGKAFTCQVKHPATGVTAQGHSRFCPGTGEHLDLLPPRDLSTFVVLLTPLLAMTIDLENPPLQKRGGGWTTQQVLPPPSSLDLRTTLAACPSPRFRLTPTSFPGKVSAPYIFTFPPHAEELSLAQVTLTCLVRGFQPEHVEVQWLRNHNSVPATEFVTTPPLKETNGDGTFFLYSKMTVPKASWQGGMSYACMVVHEGLPMKFTQRPLQKTPGK
uniref:Ig-like domain-containing protein n=1 Tax=Cairina moschata TaxID=8855 RepID=A0A8C3BR13_CAIMO